MCKQHNVRFTSRNSSDVSIYSKSATFLDGINVKQNKILLTTMADENNTPLEPLHGRELDSELGWATTISTRILKPPTTLTLFCPCVPMWNNDVSICGLDNW